MRTECDSNRGLRAVGIAAGTPYARAESMTELAATFEDHRSHLRVVAYRMLGSASEADDAVQEAWLGSRAPTSAPSRTCAAG